VDEGRPTLREDTRDEARFRRLLGIAATCVLVLVSSGSITGSDGPAAYAVAQSIVDHHALTVPRHLGFPGRGGRTYASHGLGLPLVAVPFYAVARPLARATSHPEIATAVVSLIMPLTGGLLVVALYALMRRLRASRVTSAIVSAGVVGGTFLLPYLKDFYSEPLATLFVVLAVERFLARRLGTSGGALMAAGITRPQLFLLGPLFGWRAYLENGPRGLLRLSLPVLAGVVIVLLYNVARFNDPFRFDPLQGKARLDRIPAALVELLFNPTKSVFLFAPIVLVLIPALATLRRIDNSAFWLLAGNLVIGIFVAAAWPQWDGGWTWGPRLLLPALIPASAAVAVWADTGRLRRRAVMCLCALGLLVSLPGVIVSTRAQLRAHPPLHGPSVWRQYRLVPSAIGETFTHPTSDEPEDRSIDVWQVRALRVMGPAAGPPVVVGTLLLAFGTVVALIRGRRSLRRAL